MTLSFHNKSDVLNFKLFCHLKKQHDSKIINILILTFQLKKHQVLFLQFSMLLKSL